ncbi:long-chain fatty acid--CoA ligase [Pseudacidovorax intermedius]|uniref:acyl-CoA synthetase n=1 Tax=Pseudacidovorax intermedius TaxID=433924 RepID=UPI0026F08952|nr:long-chain fatty acid--CoA ligase [Pseudacidovorax intermedius]
MTMSLTQSIHKGRREKAGETAAICGDERRTWAELAGRIERLAGALAALGVAPGDRVGMMALNSVRYLEYFYGCWWAGAVVNPVNIRWNPHEVAYSLDDCDTRVLIVDDAFAPLVPQLRQLSRSLRTVIFCGRGTPPEGALDYEALLAEATPRDDLRRGGGDLAAVMYTGGTTGRPKGVMLGHDNLYINALSNASGVPRVGVKVGLVVSPMFHVAGCGLSLLMAQRLVPQVIVPAFDEVAIMAAVQAHRANEIFLVPTMIKRLIEHPRFAEFDLSSLKLMLYGAAPIDATLLAQAMAALPGADFAQAYGMTELAPTVVTLGPEEHRPGPQRERLLRAAGRPVPIAEVRIVDGEGRELPPGEVGEITARGPMVMQGYWNKPAETAAALRDGWMHTGDMGRLDADGYLFVVDRLKDMIVSGGENVYSAEVENAIAQLPQVSMCAVIGVPDERWGERVHAVLVLREGQSLDEAEVIAHCRAHIAGYKCPRSVEFRAALPLSAAGKLQKFELRAPFWAGRSRNVN